MGCRLPMPETGPFRCSACCISPRTRDIVFRFGRWISRVSARGETPARTVGRKKNGPPVSSLRPTTSDKVFCEAHVRSNCDAQIFHWTRTVANPAPNAVGRFTSAALLPQPHAPEPHRSARRVPGTVAGHRAAGCGGRKVVLGGPHVRAETASSQNVCIHVQ